MWVVARRSSGWRTTIRVVAYIFALALTCSSAAPKPHYNRAASASAAAPCAEHHHARTGGEQQHNEAQDHDCCFGLGGHCAPPVSTPPEAASVARAGVAVAMIRAPPVLTTSRRSTRSPLPLGSRAPPVLLG